MDELIAQVLTTLRGIWRRRWVGLGVTWLAALVGVVVVFKTPDRYEASARVYVDTRSILKPLMSGLTVQPDVEQQIAILSRTIISQPNMEKLIQITELDSTVKTPNERERLIDELMRTVQVRGGGRENIYTIAYRGTDRSDAVRVVQAVLKIFVDSGVGDKREGSDAARRFIEEQISAYEIKLQEAETRLKEFKLKHLGLLGPDGRDFFARMTTLGEELAQARLQLRSAEQSRDALKRELAGEDPVFLPDLQVGSLAATSEIDVRIDALKRSLDELTRRFTDVHPDVVGARRILAQLEEQKRRELEIRSKAAAGAKGSIVASTNPVFQKLKLVLAEAEANVAALQAKVGELSARYGQLEASAKLRPQIDAELTQLNRDYEVQKRNYESLVGRRESAALTTQMDAAAGVAQFKIIDPPAVGPKPVAPNRQLLLVAVFFAAIGAGLFASFAISRVLPTFHDAAGLREITQQPVLGVVALRPTPKVISHRRLTAALFAAGVVGLASVFGAMMLVSMRAGAV